MKKYVLPLILASFSLCVASCYNNSGNINDDQSDKTVSISDFKKTDDGFLGKINNDVKTFSFINRVNVPKNATWSIYTDVAGTVEIPTKTIECEIGDNFVYLLVKNEKESIGFYKVDVYRYDIFTVSFNTNGGSSIQSQRVQEESFATRPDNPSKRGYTFDSWDFNFENPILRDTIITARWISNQYTITFDTNGGDSLDSTTKTVNFGDNCILPTPYFKGHTFEGWFYNNTRINSGIWGISEDVTLVAHWSISKYKITYDCQGGTFSDDSYEQEVTYGTNFTLKVPERKGYEFVSWMYNNNVFESGVWQLEENITLIAKWSANEYKIHFISNGGTECDDLIVKFGSDVSLPSPTKKGYTFKGWYFADELIESGQWSIASDVTLEARYEVNTYNVTLSEYSSLFGITVYIEENNGTAKKSLTVNGSNYSMPHFPHKDGYDFTGWYTNKELTQSLDLEQNLKDGQMLYAAYKETSTSGTAPLYHTEVSGYPHVDSSNYSFSTFQSVYAGTYIVNITFNTTSMPSGDCYVFASNNSSVKLGRTSNYMQDNDGKWYCEFACELEANTYYQTYTSPTMSDKTVRGTTIINYDYDQRFGTKTQGSYVISATYDSIYELGIPDSPANKTFVGWYTEQNGQGDKLTDNLGGSISAYQFDSHIMAYPYFI